MGRAPCCDKSKVKKGPWSQEEDIKLKEYIEKNGTGGNWIALPQKAGLKRCGKSCRLRWLNYLRPNIKHGAFSDDEDRIICTLFATIGSRWSIIAAQLPGRTDNDIKNYWNTKLKKKLLGIPPSQRKTNQQNHHHHHHHQQQQQQQQQLFSSIPLENMATPLPTPSSSHVLMFGGGQQQSCSPSELEFGGGDGGAGGFDNYIYGGLEDTQKVLHGGHGSGELAQILQYGSYEDIKNFVSASSTGCSSLQLDQDVPVNDFSFIRTQDMYSYYMNV